MTLRLSENIFEEDESDDSSFWDDNEYFGEDESVGHQKTTDDDFVAEDVSKVYFNTMSNAVDVDRKDKENNFFRDSSIRYMGYANEIGESFRYQVWYNVLMFYLLVYFALFSLI